MNKHILIVDDDQEIRSLLADFLGQYSFDITTASNGDEMFSALSVNSIDLIILDVLMPGDDGFTLCQKLRTDSNIPIIMLTAIGESTDRIVGLEMGADDYLAKPFNPRELLARIKAILRRTPDHKIEEAVGSAPSHTVEFNNWRLDLAARSLTSPEKLEVPLSTGEYDLLAAFVNNPQRVMSRDQLLDITHNRQAGPYDRTIDVQISRLRQKIEIDPKIPVLIKTVRGGGYMFTPTIKRL